MKTLKQQATASWWESVIILVSCVDTQYEILASDKSRRLDLRLGDSQGNAVS